MKKFQTVQGNAARLITGSFKRTSFEALDIEAFLLPIKQTFNKLIDEATLRLATSPCWEDIIRPRLLQSTRFRNRKCRIPTPLQLYHEHFRTVYRLDLADVETIHPFTVPPDWIPPRTYIRIRKTARAAAELAASTSRMSIYTDGSGIDNKVGAVAWSSEFGARGLYLGSLDEYTVYFAEVMAVDLGLAQTLEYDQSMKKEPFTVHVSIDNQAAILTIRNPKPSSGQFHIAHLLKVIDKA